MKVMVLDAYGTLFSTGTGSLDATRRILSICGRDDINAEKFYADWKVCHRKHIGNLTEFVKEETIFHWDLWQLYRDYGIRRDADFDVRQMLSTLGKRMAFPESQEAVKQLLSQSFRLCIGSTTDNLPLIQDMERNQIVVPHVFTSESLQVYKPRKTFYQRIAHYFRIEPEEILFVGDSLVDDVWGPKQVGMRTCWLNRNGVSQEEVRPDYEISDLTQLIPLLQKIAEDEEASRPPGLKAAE